MELEPLIEEAREALESGDHARARRLADELLRHAPNSSAVRKLRARVLLATNDVEEALAEARRATELSPADTDSHLLAGLSAWRAGRLTLAQASLERAIKLSGGKPSLLADYAWFMASHRGSKLAEDAALEALAVNNKSSTAWAALGIAQFRQHRAEEAHESLGRALVLDPNDPYAQAAMATFLQERRADAKAVALSRLLEDTPGTEELVADIRNQARQRRLEGLLAERGVHPGGIGRERSRWRIPWGLLLVGAVVAVLLGLLRPETSAGIFWCVFTPPFLYWLWRLQHD